MTSVPYLSYDQVFVILRVDPPDGREGGGDSGVHLLKALWSQAAAEDEVVRLNEPHRDQGAAYSWKAARLARRPAGAGSP